MARFARALPIALLVVVFAGLFMFPANAGKTSVPVSWSVTGFEVGTERVWISVENGVEIRHSRGIEIFATISGDYEGLTTVIMHSDIAVATGDGTHRGTLTLETADGTLTGQLRGTTNGAILAGTWHGNQGTGSFAKMQIRASYTGTAFTFLEMSFSGFLS